MGANLPGMLMLSAGALLMWAAVTDRRPDVVLRAVLSGKDIPLRGSGSGPSESRRGGGGTFGSPKTGRQAITLPGSPPITGV